MITAWLAHLYTGSGIVLALLATGSVIERDYRAAFFWLALQIVVDATDGVLARAARVSTHLPWFNGAKLDDIIDYVTYVFVPALIVWRVPLVPPGWALPIAAAMLLSSAFGFNREDAKTPDHFFTGFPSYWNIVVFHLMAGRCSPIVCLLWLAGLAALVFVPIRFIYPSRTRVWALATNTLGALWGIAVLVMLWQFPDVSQPLLLSSLAFPIYYVVLSVVLHIRRSSAAGAGITGAA